MHAKYHSAWFPVTLGRFIILLSMLLLTIGTQPPAVSAASNAPTASAAEDPEASAASGETPGKIFLPVISNGKPKDSGPTPPEPLPPTAQELILADQAAGVIDANTALLYRAYARYGDPRLPAKYGDGYLENDPGFDILARDPNLPADLKAQLEPFLVRPTDPKSVYNTPRTGIAPRASEPAASAQAAGLPCDAYGWTDQLSSTLYSDHQIVPIKVHVKCTYKYEQDMQTTLQYIGELWVPMTTLMGEPLLDDGADYGPQIDIYLLNPLDALMRYDLEPYPLCEGCGGFAQADDPWLGDKSSSYIVIDRQMSMGGIYYKQLLAHELFHSLQFAHNCSVTAVSGKEWWFTEASAVWAEAHFVPQASNKTHERFKWGFQYSYLSLHTPGDLLHDKANFGHIYEAYIWPFFMEQEKTALSIASVWRNLETVGSDWDLAMKKIDQELPFKSNFRRFALRNINGPLDPGDPIRPRYMDLDPKFPDGEAPHYFVNITDVGAQPRSKPLLLDPNIPSLLAKYYYFTFKSDVLRVELDLGNAASLDGVAVGAIVLKRNGSWKYEDLTGQSKVKWCDVLQMYLIVSNERMKLNDPVDVRMNLYPLAESCVCPPIATVEGWDASFNLSYSIQADSETWGVTDSRGVTLGGYLEPPYPTPMPFNFTAKPTGNGYINSRSVFHTYAGDDPDDYYTGSGLPEAEYGSHLSLTFDLQKCTYRVLTDIYIHGTVTHGKNAPTPVDILIVHAGSGDIPIPENLQNGLTGSGNWPAHSILYFMQNPGSYDFFQDFSGAFSVLDENSLGAAKVTWSFLPVFKQ